MFRSVSNNFSIASPTVSIAAAALVTGIAIFLMPATPKAEAQTIGSHLAKADRLPVLAKKNALHADQLVRLRTTLSVRRQAFFK